jgi:hypothetical protein
LYFSHDKNKRKTTNFFLRKISFFLIIFLFLTFPGYKMTYGNIFDKIFINISGNISDYWGYYGAFILGKESIILNIENINLIKELWDKNSTSSIFLKIANINIKEGYYFFFINIPLSLIGLFTFTIGKINYWYEYLLVLLSIYLLYFSFKSIFFNIRIIFCQKEKFYILCKSIIIFFFIFSGILFYVKSYWSIIKLYFFFSYIILLTIILKYNKKNYLSINYILLFLIIIFPFYQYSENNSGIGKINSFPSIIRKSYKQEFNWDISVEEIKNCKKIYISIDDDRFNWHKFAYANIVVASNNVDSNVNKEKKLKENFKYKICIIKENKKEFTIFRY